MASRRSSTAAAASAGAAAITGCTGDEALAVRGDCIVRVGTNEDVLKTKGNAVMLWHKHPGGANENLVEGCLR